MLAYAITKPGNNQGELIHLPIPKLEQPNFCLIKVLRAGVCNTDLEILQGYMGFQGVLGHEFVGVVESINTNDEDVLKEWIGQRVCGDINIGCGDCGVCANDYGYDDDNGCGSCCHNMSRNHCPNRSVLGILQCNGCMAEYIALPLCNLHKVPDGMSDEVAVFSEPLAAACRIVEQKLVRYDAGEKRKPDKVAILGDGKLGLMIAEVLGREHISHFGNDDNDGTTPPKPVLFGKHLSKLKLVSVSGVNGCLVEEAIDKSAFNGVSSKHAAKYDVVVDATGSPAGLTLAAGLCRPMGTLVLKSTCAAGEQFNAAPFVIDELRVVGSRCGPIYKALELLNLKEEGVDSSSSLKPLNVEKYITRVFPLSEAPEAIKCAAERSTMKVQIICD